MYGMHGTRAHRSESITKIIIGVIEIVVVLAAMTPVFLLEKQPSAFAITQFQSGFNHGIQDGQIRKLRQ